MTSANVGPCCRKNIRNYILQQRWCKDEYNLGSTRDLIFSVILICFPSEGNALWAFSTVSTVPHG